MKENKTNLIVKGASRIASKGVRPAKVVKKGLAKKISNI